MKKKRLLKLGAAAVIACLIAVMAIPSVFASDNVSGSGKEIAGVDVSRLVTITTPDTPVFPEHNSAAPSARRALTAQAATSYNDHDVTKIQEFLNRLSAVSGKTNAQALGYNAADPSTWTDVTWNSNGNAQTIYWDGRSLGGTLDLNGLASLTELSFSGNRITGLDIRGCTALKYFDGSGNMLTSLDTDALSALEYVDASNNILQYVGVNGNPALQYLDISGNGSIVTYFILNLPALTELYCNDDNLGSTLDLSTFPSLQYLDCSGNGRLESLGTSGGSSLIALNANSDHFSSLDMSRFTSLQLLDVSNITSMLSLNVSGLSSLQYLDYSSDSNLSPVDLSGLSSLAVLYASSSGLSSLDLTGLGALQALDCSNNSITSLNISGSANLIAIDCSKNKLSSLNTGSAANLIGIDCSSNKLTSLDVTSASVEYLDCSGNPLGHVGAVVNGNNVVLTAAGQGYVGLFYDSSTGDAAKATATPVSPAVFGSWTKSGTTVSTTAELNITSAGTYTANFVQAKTGTVVNCTSGVNVRSGPGSTYSILGTAPKGATYNVTGQSGSWYKIDFNGKVGYISTSYMSVSSGGQNPPPSSQTGTVVNCTSGVNVRSGPGSTYSILGTAPKGATYTVTGQSGSWYKIDFNGKVGYISTSYLSVSSSGGQNPPPSSQTGTVVNCTTGVNVRSGPGSTYSILGTAPKGATYTVTGQSGSWYKIDFNGKVGYISSSYLSVSSGGQNPPPSSQTGTVVNCTSGVNVRSGPGSTYSILGTAPKGATYTVTGQSGSWYKIDFNGKTGYISSSYLSVTTASS